LRQKGDTFWSRNKHSVEKCDAEGSAGLLLNWMLEVLSLKWMAADIAVTVSLYHILLNT